MGTGAVIGDTGWRNLQPLQHQLVSTGKLVSDGANGCSIKTWNNEWKKHSQDFNR